MTMEAVLSFSVAQQNAAVDALKKYLFLRIEEQAGIFSGAVEDDLTDDIIVGAVEVILTALERTST
jgi:hypothetical protein